MSVNGVGIGMIINTIAKVPIPILKVLIQAPTVLYGAAHGSTRQPVCGVLIVTSSPLIIAAAISVFVLAGP